MDVPMDVLWIYQGYTRDRARFPDISRCSLQTMPARFVTSSRRGWVKKRGWKKVGFNQPNSWNTIVVFRFNQLVVCGITKNILVVCGILC